MSQRRKKEKQPTRSMKSSVTLQAEEKTDIKISIDERKMWRNNWIYLIQINEKIYIVNFVTGLQKSKAWSGSMLNSKFKTKIKKHRSKKIGNLAIKLKVNI